VKAPHTGTIPAHFPSLTPVEYEQMFAPPTGTVDHALANLILLCPRHHKRLHDHHIRTSASGEKPVFTNPTGRLITTNQPHAPPP
jgi:hypothetical protein